MKPRIRPLRDASDRIADAAADVKAAAMRVGKAAHAAYIALALVALVAIIALLVALGRS